MNIDNINSHPGRDTSAETRNRNISPNAHQEKTLLNITDSFNSANPINAGEISKTDLTSLIFQNKGLEKKNYNYTLKSQEQGSDGIIYAAYSDAKKPEGNYISATAPDGTVKWETRAGENGLESLRVGPDGTIYARTKDQLAAFDPKGKEVFRHTFEGEVKDHMMDSKGNNYFRRCHGNSLYAVSPDGNRITLAGDVEYLSPNEIKVTADGTFWCRQDGRITAVNMDSGTKEASYTFKDTTTESKEKCTPTTFFPAPDGVLVVGQSTTYIPPASQLMYGDFHAGLGFGGRFGMPHPHRDEDFMGTTIQNNYIFKLDQEGEVQWKSPELGSSFQVSAISSGEVIYTDNRTNTDKKIVLNKMSPEGNPKEIASFDDTIRSLHIRPGDDHIFVRTGTGLTHMDTDGNLLHTRSFGGEPLLVAGFGKENDILLSNDKKTVLYSWDPNTDTLRTITNHELDHSYKSLLDQVMEKKDMPPETHGDSKGIEDKGNYVDISGVELTKKKKKF